MVQFSANHDPSVIFGKEFSYNRLEAVVSAVLESPPTMAAHVAGQFLEQSSDKFPILLATLFANKDVETAHRILCETRIPWSGTLQLEVRALLIQHNRDASTLPLFNGMPVMPAALQLFERYLLEGEDVLTRAPVVLPAGDTTKFMLMRINDCLFFRAGGRYHRDIISSTIREFLDSGLSKSATTVAPLGGGHIGPLNNGVCIYGESTDYGKADFRRVKELLLSSIPNLEVRIM
jgi:hypothetical protein